LANFEDGVRNCEDGVFILGAGGHAKVVAATLQEAGIPIAAFLDDDPGKIGSIIAGVQVAGSLDTIIGKGKVKAVIALGDNRTRKEAAIRFQPYCRWITAIHPLAVIHESVKIEEGTVVFAGAVIQPDTRIGRHVIVNTGVTIDHDCDIRDFAHLGPGTHLAGNVALREGCLLGVGVAVIPGRQIGEWSTVGANASVVADVPDGVIAVGVPAQVIKEISRD